MKKLFVIFSLLFVAFSVTYAQSTETQSVNRAGTYLYTHSDTVTADSSQVYELYSKFSKTAELIQGVYLTKVSGYVKARVIRSYSLSGDSFTNLDTVLIANTASDEAIFSVVDHDYPYWKITVDGYDSTQVVYPLKFYSIIKEK
jgi:hypothetical protein